MKLAEISMAVERTVNVTLEEGSPPDVGTEVRLGPAGDGRYVLWDAEAAYTGVASSERDALTLKLALDGSHAHIYEIAAVDDVRVFLRVLVFASRIVWSAPRDIGVSDDVLTRLAGELRGGSASDVLKMLMDEFVLDRSQPSLLLDVGSDALDEDATAFRMVGPAHSAAVRLINDQFVITRLTRHGGRRPERLHLVEVEVSFTDISHAARVDEVARAEVGRLYQSNTAYFNVWRQYAELELEQAIATAEKIGWCRYHSFEVLPDGSYRFSLDEHPRSDHLLEQVLGDSLDLAASRVLPGEQTSTTATVHGQAEGDIENYTILVRPLTRPRESPPQVGVIYGSRAGETTKHRRREEALTAAEPIPLKAVRQLLEGLRPAAPGISRTRVEALSPAVVRAFGGRPTPAQLDALDVALNTPDVALIQGPPGTGKTRVIAALQARLAELAAGEPATHHRTLLTAEQHDAVTNAVAAAVDARLPPIKLGGRVGHGDDEHLAEWAFALRTKLEERHHAQDDSGLLAALFELQDRVTAYRLDATDIHATVELLEWMRFEAAELLSDDARREVASELSRLTDLARRQFSPQHLDELDRTARAIRTTHETFTDDGRETARRAFTLLRQLGLGEEAELETLRAALVALDPTPALLDRLRHVQAEVLDACVAGRESLRADARDTQVSKVLDRCEEDALRRIDQTFDAAARTVAAFRRSLRHEPSVVRRSILRHTSALAATCQQAGAEDIHQAQLSDQPFETVIIDEAARANPLDLRIPMMLATKRIVLVGDHRQLPVLLEPVVEAQLAERVPSEALEATLHQSFFERLFSTLQDGETRAARRTVTLDRQFRMHPLLGTFVNQQFYAPHGENVSNASEDAEAFAHPLRYDGPAIWLDVSRRAGREGGGRSKSRPVEAQRLVQELIAAVEATTQMTFGVITFYRRQREQIWRELARADRAVAQGDDFVFAPSWGEVFNEAGVPRVRIGTVDSFQGREFDAVFLSTVRSNDLPVRRPLDRSRRFGFLLLENRLCVAMSRQRQLLIVVGDASMFTDDVGRESVPALAAFHDLAVSL